MRRVTIPRRLCEGMSKTRPAELGGHYGLLLADWESDFLIAPPLTRVDTEHGFGGNLKAVCGQFGRVF